MSLINQMLKDLDKRGSGANASEITPGPIRAVPERGGNSRALMIGLVLIALIGAGAGWFFWQQQAAAPTAPAIPATPEVKAEIPPPAPEVADSKPLPVTAQPEEKPARQDVQTISAKPATTETAIRSAERSALPAMPEPAARHASRAPSTTHTVSAREFRMMASGPQGKETTPQQQADNSYNRAISLISSGQTSAAIGELEEALHLNPGHAAARQTLAGLLLDARRPDAAGRTLEEGLKLDPSQWGLAMILARIQLEHKGAATALTTLKRSLPYANRRPDYLAFMAALLQREKRHKEAIAFYAISVEKAPQNGHWWMGYGISLKADGRPDDARRAFIRARDSQSLSPNLQAFVEQEIGKLSGS